jgi:hypothetical protein
MSAMTKLIAVVLVAALAYGGWRLGHGAHHAAQAVATLAVSIPDQAALASAELNLSQAAPAASAYDAANGSYEGLTVAGATVGSASATGYCLEDTVAGVTAHLSGPNGTPAAGPCPA